MGCCLSNEEVDKTDPNYASYAIRYKDADALKQFILEGGDVNAVVCENGYNLIFAAVWWNKPEMLKILIDFGKCDLNYRLIDLTNHYNGDQTGLRPIMLALLEERIDIANILIDAGCDLNCQDRHGTCILAYAVSKSSFSVAKKIIDGKCDINLKNNDGNSAFLFACAYGNMDLIKLLIHENCDVENKNNDGYSGFLLACHHGEISVIKMFFELNWNMNEKNFNGLNGCDLSLKGNHFKCVADLVSYGCTLNTENKNFSEEIIQNLKLAIGGRIIELNECKEMLKIIWYDAPPLIIDTLWHFSCGVENLQNIEF
jgi:ankyrin repeat protein